MQLQHLCDYELTYRSESLYEGAVKYVAPYGTSEGSLYGEGGGSFRGMGLNGTARWVNHARRRSDGVNLPDVHGIIRTDEGPYVLFTFQGRTLPVLEDKLRRQLLSVLFEAEDERYAWLNSAVCVLEGLFAPETNLMRGKIYACVHELS
jgi:hypothetical protein